MNKHNKTEQNSTYDLDLFTSSLPLNFDKDNDILILDEILQDIKTYNPIRRGRSVSRFRLMSPTN